MTTSQLISSFWARLGTPGGNALPKGAADLERLIVETAKGLAREPEVLAMVAAWLGDHQDLLARHRLRRIIIKELAGAELAAMGLMLDLARGGRASVTLDFLISACKPLAVGRPLAASHRGRPLLVMLARDHASDVFKHWGLWHPPLPQPSAARGRDWILQHNPTLRERALLGNGLKASVLACLRHDLPKGAGESDLALACGATRKAVHQALDALQQGGWVTRTSIGNRHTYRLARGKK